MSSTEPTPARIRASDAERERVATRVQSAGAAGRLTITETDERVAAVYAATFTDELAALTADLPPDRPSPRRPPVRALRVHAAIAVALSVLLVVRWVVSGADFFWPVMPIFWLAVSVAGHAWVRGFPARRRDVVPY
ncbi:DUF1707 SHOCT-like domain-containing protein [Amycolatopsis albispora]|uniref:DUF1707 domain-containing protein n=1 Tax=Amycolatopsis albispora TaxID=1804986 RepID=A0A344LFU6_9PSEU|nr:DUF1707 domain-containing protein [Amycolatopsis albispora]AXB46920.1 hypothetical protein A4R43_34440 [Amycolatopsis albispora]